VSVASSLPITEEESGRGDSVAELLEQARSIEDADISRARSLVQQARVLARTRGEQAGEAEALYRLAELSYASSLPNEALAVAIESRDLAHECGAAKTEVSALNLIAAVQYHAANFSEALASALAALDLYRASGERASEGMLLNSLAVIQHSLRDTDRAIVTYEAALMANKGQERPDLDAITLANMAKVRAERNENLLAVSLGESALELASEHAPEFVPEILARLGMAYVALSSLDRAASCLDQAEDVLRDRTARRVALSPGSVVTVRTARGELYVAQHLRDHAIREWGDALELATQAGMTEIALMLREKLAELNKQMGRFEQALMHQEARFALNDEIFTRSTELRIRTLQVQHDTETSRLHSELLRLRTTEVEQMVQQRTRDVEAAYLGALQRVAAFAESYNTDVVAHPQRVGTLAEELAWELGLDRHWAELLREAATLHDVGKVATPDAVLRKVGPLTASEFEQVKLHTTLGAAVLRSTGAPLLALAEEVAVSHHERWDGSGYPFGLGGEEIPLSGRIVAVAEVYDSLVGERAYKRSWGSAEAVSFVRAGRGSQFDPMVVDAFLSVMARRAAMEAVPER